MPRAGWLACGAAGAALIGSWLPAWAIIAAGAVALAAAATLGAARRWPACFLAIGAAVLLVRIAVPAALAPPEQVGARPPTDERSWHAEVVSLGSLGGGGQRAVLLVWAAGGEPTAPDEGGGPTRYTVWAQLPRYPAVAPGDRLAFQAAVEPIEEGSGFAAYLARIGAVGTIRVREMSAAPGSSPVEGLRREAGRILARTMPAPQAGLAAGILVGLRDQVDRDVAAAFTASGLSHVVAISGWNIALVAGCLAALLRRLDRRPRQVLTVAAIVAYTILAGASPSVVRAAVMAAIVIAARESGRPGRAATALGLAAGAILVIDPAFVMDAGFQLSVLATAGLLAWAGPLTAALCARLPGWLPGWLVEALGVSLAAQAATLPVVVLAFGRLSLVAPLANLVMAPLVAPAMAIGALALVLGAGVSAGLPGLLALPAATAGWAAFGAMIGIASGAAALPFASLELGSPWDAAGATMSALLLGAAGTRRGRSLVRALLARRPGQRTRSAPVAGGGNAGPQPAGARRRRRPLVAVAACLGLVAALLALVVVARPDGRLRMTVLDVGQGDAILLEGDRGGRILIDAGPDADRLLALLDARLPPWDRRLDFVVLTHPHEDHVAGLALLLERYAVGALAEPGMRGPGPGYAAYEQALARLGRTSQALVAGDHLSLDGARLTVRWPRGGEVPEEPPDSGTGINNVSIVLDVRFGVHRLLLTGDVEEEIDPQLLADGLMNASGGLAGAPDGSRRQPIDVLKVAHHGSRTASTGPFLEQVQPRVAIVSAGTGNRYGHPDPGTLERLRAAGARVFRTDTDGSVTITSDGTTLTVAASGGRHAPVHRADADVAPTIAGWASLSGSPPPVFSCGLSRPTGSSSTAALWPRWPRSSPDAWRRPMSMSSRWLLPPSFTMSTGSSRPTMSWRRSATARQALPGSSAKATASWPRPSKRIPSSGSALATRAGRRASGSRSGSSPTPTSASRRTSSRSTSGSTTWPGAIPATRPRSVPRGPPWSDSSRRSARPAGCGPWRSDVDPG